MPRARDLYRYLLARRVYLFDAALALLLALLSLPQVKAGADGATAADRAVALWWAFGAMLIAGLLIQHRWPLPALALTGAAAAAHALARDPHGPQIGFPTLIHLAVPITLYTLASRGRSRRVSLTALSVLMLTAIAITFVDPISTRSDKPAAGSSQARDTSGVDPSRDLDRSAAGTVDKREPFSTLRRKVLEPGMTVLLSLALAYALGEGTRSRHAHLRVLEQRAADLEREQYQRVALATATERARIGRDLHDVVAHSLSVIVAQAQAATAAQHRHPDRTAQALREVITVGRESLSEMRRLVGAFGSEPDPHGGPAPPVGVAALPVLIERIRAAGVQVQFAHDDSPADLPSGVDMSVYRIVQEALTNTLKHAGAGAQASVRLATSPGYVDLEVTDDGAGRPATPITANGNGLRGIAERVHLLGGTLTVGPTPDGGFAVRARLPVSSQHPASSRHPAPTGSSGRGASW